MAYPNKIDTITDLPIAIDNVTPVSGFIFNKLRNALLATQSELGIKPSGTFGTVRARLDYIDFLFQNLNAVSLGKDLGGTTEETLVIGIQGNPVSSVTPNINEALIWDGLAWSPSPIFILSLQTQSEWHIDSINGDDRNSGVNSSNKIKTFAELQRRIGPVWLLNYGKNVTIYVYEDVPDNDPAHFNINSLGGILYVKGVPKVKRSITLSSWRSRNTTSNIPNGATAVSVSTWNPARGLDLNDNSSGDNGSQGLYTITSGVNSGAFIWSIKDEGGGTVRLTEGGVPIPDDDYNEDFLGTMNGNETLNQLRLPIIERISFINCSGDNLEEPGQNLGYCVFQFLQFGTPDPSFNFNKNISIDGEFFSFRECIFSGSIVEIIKYATFVNCIIAAHGFVPLTNSKSYSTHGALIGLVFYPQPNSTTDIGRYNLFQGCSTNGQEGLYTILSHTRGFGIFDSTTTILSFVNGSKGRLIGPIWGSGNTGYGIEINGGCTVVHNEETKTISTSLGNLIIGDRTSLPAYDESLDSWTSPRALSFTNLAAAVTSGGFGQVISYPAQLCGLIKQ